MAQIENPVQFKKFTVLVNSLTYDRREFSVGDLINIKETDQRLIDILLENGSIKSEEET